MNTQTMRPFVAPDIPATWTKVLLLAGLILTFLGLGSQFLQIELLSRAEMYGISDAEANANDLRQQVVGTLQVIVYVATGVAFLIWFYRVHRNLPSLGGRRLKYRSGWAIGGFFVPILILVRPLQIMRETWHGSDPSGIARDAAPDGPSLRNQLGTPALIGWWWALFLISCVLGRILMRMALAPDQSIADLQTLSTSMVFADLLDIPLTILVFRIVSKITRWQTERHHAMTEGSAEVASNEAATFSDLVSSSHAPTTLAS